MKTSQLVIVCVMILVLGAMGFVYLTDRETLSDYRHQKTTLSAESSEEANIKRLQKENEILRDKNRIVELEREVAALKQQLASADLLSPSGAQDAVPELPAFTTTGTGGSSALEAMKAENERLKLQNRLAVEESSIIAGKGVEEKEKALRLEQYVSSARAMAKVGEVNREHHFVVVTPIGQPNFSTKEGSKQALLVRRDNKPLLKLVIDSLDAQSGQYIAMIDPAATQADLSQVKQGDEIILAPEEPAQEESVPSLPEAPASSGFPSSGGLAAPAASDAPGLPTPPWEEKAAPSPASGGAAPALPAPL